MRARFERKGPLAIASAAYGQEYELVTPAAPTSDNGIAVVMVMGPLTHHGDWWGGDTYDAIESRVAAALATSAGTVVLKIASPGGEVDGCFECAKTLRKMAAAAGKRLVAYVDEHAFSAAYALACAASEIYLPPAAAVGSIGVLEAIVDASAADAMQGVNVALITSGAHKADGNPHAPLTDATRIAVQAQVDRIANLFFDLVGEARGINPLDVQAMQAGIFRGADAVGAKLADGVMSWDDLLARLTAGEPQPTAATAEAASGNMETAMTRTEMLAALKAALAEDEPPPPDKSEDDKDMSPSELKAALKALLAEGEPEHEEPDGDEPAPAPAPAPAQSAAASDPVAQALAIAQQAKAEAAALRAEMQAKAESVERTKLLDERKDLDPKARAILETKPLAYVREALEMIPRIGNPLAAAAQVQPTLGADQAGDGTRAPQLSAEEHKALCQKMGLDSGEPPVRREGNRLVLSAVNLSALGKGV